MADYPFARPDYGIVPCHAARTGRRLKTPRRYRSSIRPAAIALSIRALEIALFTGDYLSLGLRNVEDLLFERGIAHCHETVRLWWNRFGPLFAAEIRRQRVSRMRAFRHWRWHVGEVYVRINGEMHYLWRAVNHEGEVLESFVTKKRDKSAALRFFTKILKPHGLRSHASCDH